MVKRKGFDPIQDAHELEEHNINPYYWINKVTSFTYAKMMVNKRLAILCLPFIIAQWYLIGCYLHDAAQLKSITIWQWLLDLSTTASLAFWAYLIMLALVTVLYTLLVVTNFTSKPPMRMPRPKELRKRLPKRRKDYGRHH